LRLAFCPQCDYSLQGLPDAGTCPECGREYDQAFVVLRGKPTGGNSPAATLWFFAGIALLLFVLHLLHPGTLLDPVILLIVGVPLLAMGIALVGSQCSVRPGEVLLWLSASGIGQQSPLIPGSLSARSHRWLGYVSQLVLLFPAAIGLRHNRILLISMIAFWLGIQLLVRWANWAGLPTIARPAEGVRPAMHPWRIFDEVSFKPLGKNRYRLRARVTNWVRRWTLVSIVIEMPDAHAEQLRSQTARWRGADLQRGG
jgi:hypothetical protein